MDWVESASTIALVVVDETHLVEMEEAFALACGSEYYTSLFYVEILVVMERVLARAFQSLGLFFSSPRGSSSVIRLSYNTCLKHLRERTDPYARLSWSHVKPSSRSPYFAEKGLDVDLDGLLKPPTIMSGGHQEPHQILRISRAKIFTRLRGIGMVMYVMVFLRHAAPCPITRHQMSTLPTTFLLLGRFAPEFW